MMSDKHEQARDLGEQALDAINEGDEAKADALIEEAKKLDKTALEELVQDLDEGAGDPPSPE
jgi:phage shock protein A